MKDSIFLKSSNTVQKIGLTLILIAGLMTILRIFDVLPEDYYSTHNLRNYIFLAGFTLFVIPKYFKSSKVKKSSTLLITLLITVSVFAQDYSKQIQAFSKSFNDKSTEALQAYTSAKLQFGQIPIANTPAIMKNIVMNLPKLNSMVILESSEGKAKVAYDFEGLGKSESYIYFDNEGKIMRIELVENLIRQEAEATRQQQQSVQLPVPGVLGEKYRSSEINFSAPDGLLITANLYEIDPDKPVVLLMHQAGYNRAEYADIAPKLNEMGYNCLAVDLRSGGTFAEKTNKTNAEAIEKGLRPGMIDAKQDVNAAVDYLYNKYKQKVIVLGSSFSSSLALLEGYKNNKVKGIVSFSPGDYFGDTVPSLATVFSEIKKPFLVTSSKAEASALKALIGNTKLSQNQQQFIPKSEGFHGARALWEGQKGAVEYWEAIIRFLNLLKQS